jgi:hypothetical protein
LRKQNFEVFNQYSVYEHALHLSEINDSSLPPISIRDINRSDRALFKEIEKKTKPQSVLRIKGSAGIQYFCLGGKAYLQDLPDFPDGSKQLLYPVKRSVFCTQVSRTGSKKAY